MYFVILSAYNLLSTYSSVNQNLNFSFFSSLYIQHILPQNHKTVILILKLYGDFTNILPSTTVAIKINLL